MSQSHAGVHTPVSPLLSPISPSPPHPISTSPPPLKYFSQYLHSFFFLLFIGIFDNKSSDRSMEVKLLALLGNCNRQTNRPTDGQTGSFGSFPSNNNHSPICMYVSISLNVSWNLTASIDFAEALLWKRTPTVKSDWAISVCSAY